MKKENGSGKDHSGKKAVKAKKKYPKKDLGKWYDNADLMIMLKVSASTLARYRKNGKIPFNKLFGKILYPKDIVDSIMMQNLENKHLLEEC
jgi:hypothetical protein